MPRGKGNYYDEDDFYDYDEGYDEDYGDYDDYAAPKQPAGAKPQAKQAGGKAPAKGGSAKTKQPASQAGASRLAQYICDPNPPRSNGKPQKGAKKASKTQIGQQGGFSMAPASAGRVQGFQFDKPSPDDLVQAATRGGDSHPSVEAVRQGVGEMSLGPEAEVLPSRPKTDAQKKLVRRAMAEYEAEGELARLCGEAAEKEGCAGGGRGKLHLVVLGHVDAGKSTLMGRLLHDLGFVGQREVHKNQKEAAQAGKASFSWAWVLDERPEERARGVTVDVAMSRFQTVKHSITLLDAPGHRDFVPNMIGGASQADAALLVVDGSHGGFEAGFETVGSGFRKPGGGQTREHAQLARSLGIEQVAVVITKLDTCDFSKDRFEEVQAVLLPFLKQCGFRESRIQWLPASAPLGINMAAKPAGDGLLGAWWRGPTLVEAIDSFTAVSRNTDVPLRLPISDVFKSRSLGGCAAGGKVEGGALRVGGKVLVMPAAETATVKALEVDGQSTQVARAGDSCDVGLTDVDASALFPGSVLCTPEWPVYVAARFEVRAVVLEPPIPIIPGLQVALHAHTAREEGKITKLVSILNPKTGEVSKAKPRCLLKGQTAVIEVTPSRGMCLEEYSVYRALGRLAIRESGRTIAVGIVTKVHE